MNALQLLLQEYRTRRMARFTAWILAYGVALWLADRLARASGGVPGLLWFVFWAGAIVASTYYLGRLVRVVRTRLLWRLRRRLVMAYVFIAFVPILLILSLVVLGEFIISGQLAAYLVVLKLRDHFDEIEQVNRVVMHEARSTGEKSPQVMLEGIQRFYLTELVNHKSSYPGLVISLHLRDTNRAFRLDGKPAGNLVTIPSWMKNEEFAGMVIDDGLLALRSVARAPTPAGELTLVLSQPFTPELLDMVGEGIGPVGVVVTKRVEPASAENAKFRVDTAEGTFIPSASVNSRSLKLPDPVIPLDFVVVGASSLDPVLWGGDRQRIAAQPAFVYVASRFSALSNQLLATLGEYSRIYVFAFKTVAVIFLLIEGAALIIGVRMTRSITGTVDKLYSATERVKTGDFSYRLQIPPHDQLSALCGAFDGMTASVERLLKESQERMRLQSELDIAREVQSRLFPQAAPKVPGLELYGVCKAARSVSGDYYDFLTLDEHRVALVLGDVSGKGISAALLMAAIQSALRAQFYNGVAPDRRLNPSQLSASQVVDRLNRQLYENTPPEKYVTFFFAVYDARTRKLTYTNAGHLPPLLFRGDKMERLEAGGTVVGLFPHCPYEEGEVQLQPADVLLAYTDGITEPENIYGEEFGEARVLEVMRGVLRASPQALAEEVYRSVQEWTGSPDLYDDMTLVLARSVA